MKKPRQIAPAGQDDYAATLAGMTVSNSSAKLQTWPLSLAAIAGVGRRWPQSGLLAVKAAAAENERL